MEKQFYVGYHAPSLPSDQKKKGEDLGLAAYTCKMQWLPGNKNNCGRLGVDRTWKKSIIPARDPKQCVRSGSRKSRDLYRCIGVQRGDGGDEVKVGVSECG